MVNLYPNEPINLSVRACLAVRAGREKMWALRTQHDGEWLRNACGMSKEMLEERLAWSVDQITDHHYNYLNYRRKIPSSKHDIRVWYWMSLQPEQVAVEEGWKQCAAALRAHNEDLIRDKEALRRDKEMMAKDKESMLADVTALRQQVENLKKASKVVGRM